MFVFCKILIISHFSSWLRFQRLCCRLRGYQFHFVVTIRVQMLLTLPAYVLVLTSNMGSTAMIDINKPPNVRYDTVDQRALKS